MSFNRDNVFLTKVLGFFQYKIITSKIKFFRKDLSFDQIMTKYQSERKRYEYFVWYFKNHLKDDYVQHRHYFKLENRGFGEDAFHAMWVKLFESFSIQFALEIGVYRGQTISLWNLISSGSKTLGPTEYWGLSPLNSSGDDVSQYIKIDYESDIRQSFAVFKLGEPKIFKALSTDIEAKEFVLGKLWDLVYVDGSHDQDIVENDVMLALNSLKAGGLLVMDDSSLYSSFNPPVFAFKGHPGPSMVAKFLESKNDFQLLGTCGHNRIYKKN